MNGVHVREMGLISDVLRRLAEARAARAKERIFHFHPPAAALKGGATRREVVSFAQSGHPAAHESARRPGILSRAP